MSPEVSHLHVGNSAASHAHIPPNLIANDRPIPATTDDWWLVSGSLEYTRRFVTDLKTQFDEVQNLRRDLGIMRQLYTRAYEVDEGVTEHPAHINTVGEG